VASRRASIISGFRSRTRSSCTRSTPYDELGLDDPALTDDALIDAMVAHPILIDRPIVVTDRGVKLCRPSETVLGVLANPQRGALSKEDGEAVVDAAGNRIAGIVNLIGCGHDEARDPDRTH
jgi:hypothetical protein